MTKDRYALMRPAPSSRAALIVGLAVVTFISIMFAATLEGPSRFVFLLWIGLLYGLLANGFWNQGTWLLGDSIVLEAILGRATVMIADVLVIHIDEAQTTAGVRTRSHFIVQSIATPLPLSGGADPKGRVSARLKARGLTYQWHADGGDVYGVAKPISPFMYPGAIVGTLTRPLVWGCIFGWLAYGLLLELGGN